MMILNIFFIIYSKLFFTDVKYALKMNLNDKVVGGYDGRFNSSSDLDDEIISKIKKNNYKMSLLKYLNNLENSMLDKIKILEKSHLEEFQVKIAPNMEAGGLFNDWDFTF